MGADAAAVDQANLRPRHLALYVGAEVAEVGLDAAYGFKSVLAVGVQGEVGVCNDLAHAVVHFLGNLVDLCGNGGVGVGHVVGRHEFGLQFAVGSNDEFAHVFHLCARFEAQHGFALAVVDPFAGYGGVLVAVEHGVDAVGLLDKGYGVRHDVLLLIFAEVGKHHDVVGAGSACVVGSVLHEFINAAVL